MLVLETSVVEVCTSVSFSGWFVKDNCLGVYPLLDLLCLYKYMFISTDIL